MIKFIKRILTPFLICKKFSDIKNKVIELEKQVEDLERKKK